VIALAVVWGFSGTAIDAIAKFLLSCADLGQKRDRIERADVIVRLDVIEHLPDPRGTLALLGRHLEPMTEGAGGIAARIGTTVSWLVRRPNGSPP
jgi:hypothetical protein